MPIPMILAVLLCASVGVAQVSASAQAGQREQQTWSRFRGPNGTGVAETGELPVEFGPDRGLVWKAELPPGHSSPVLSASRVFLTAFEDEKLWTICLERSTGTEIWRREAPRARVTRIDPRNNSASPTPAVSEDIVVVFFPDFGLLAYDHDGEERWRVRLGPFNNLYGMGASPVLHGGRAFLACDQSTGSYLLAVDGKDGAELWRVDRPRATSGHSTPILYEPEDGGPQLILPGSFLLDAYDTDSGERVWWVSGLSFEMKSVPLLHDGMIYINGYGSPMNQPGNQITVPPFEEVVGERDADGDGAIAKGEMPPSRASAWFDFVDLGKDGSLDASDWAYLQAALASQNGMLAIQPGGRGDMTDKSVKWSYRRSVPQLPSPLVYRDVLYMLNDQGGLLTTLRPSDGEVLERGRLEDAVDNYYASPVAGDGKVYFVSENGLVTVLPAGGSLEPLAVNDLDETCYATPALAGAHIYLRTRSALYCFGK